MLNILLCLLLILISIGLLKVVSKIQKERKLSQQKAILEIKIKKGINIILSISSVILAVIPLLLSGNLSKIDSSNILLILIIIILPFLCTFILLKNINIVITEDGLLISNRLVGWIDIHMISNYRYSIKIKTKRNLLKNENINKILYNINNDDIALLKKLFLKAKDKTMGAVEWQDSVQ